MTHMVLSEVESSLRTLLEANGQSIENIVRARFDGSERHLDDPLGQLYWRELWDFAAKYVSPEDAESVKSLGKRAASESIISARNAVAHGNRIFLLHYWYAIASFVTSPEFSELKFEKVQSAFVAACEGKITKDLQPLETLEKYFSKIPNNLPEPEFSKFFGREKEKKELKNALKSKRLNTIAVCGPGGTGKTALIVKVLNELLYTNSFDKLYFYTFKTEKLTSEGITKIGIKKEISDLETDFKQFLSGTTDTENVSLTDYGKQSICVCIDNLEDVLSEQDEPIYKFLDSLPEHWKVLFSSRITPRDAKLIAIEELAPGLSKKLLFDYSKEKYGNDFVKKNHKNFDFLTTELSGNPLALRLAVDLLNAGFEPNSIAENVKSMVSEFSFSRLENYLKEQSIYVLELIRQYGLPSKEALLDILDWDKDDVFSALREVERSSLISKEFSDEDDDAVFFKCSNFTKSFLLSNGKAQECRGEITLKINTYNNRDSLANSLNSQTFNSDHFFSAPAGTSSKSLQILKDHQLIFRKDYYKRRGTVEARKIQTALTDWQSAASRKYKLTSYYWMVRARFLDLLNDPEANKCFQKSFELQKGSKEKTIVLSLWTNYLFSRNEYQRIVEILNGNIDLISTNFSLRATYIKSLMFTNNPENLKVALDIVSPASDTTGVTFFFGIVKRLIESGVQGYDSEIEEALRLSLEYVHEFDEKHKSYFEDFLTTLICKALSYYKPLEEGSQKYLEKAILLLLNEDARFDNAERILDAKFVDIIHRLNERNPLISSKKIILKYNEIEQSFYVNDDMHLRERVSSGELLSVKVRTIKETYCFCTDDMSNDHFLPFSNLIAEHWVQKLIRTGSKLAILPGDVADRGKSPVVREAYVLAELEH